MRWLIAAALLVALLLSSLSEARFRYGGGATTTSGNFTFTALHTYYISPTGSDSNFPCTTSAAPCLTANHAVVCGDVFIAAAGSYTTQFQQEKWGTVSSCPSTSAGIDGTGGVYFATVVCAGPNMGSCPITGGSNEGVRVDASNWAVEGFDVVSSTDNCYTATSEVGGAVLHYVAFINDIATDCAGGFGTYGYQTAPSGFDQTAVVGVIAYNAAVQTAECSSGISIIPQQAAGDTGTGTFYFVAGAFAYKNIDKSGCSGGSSTTDGEGLIFDSWACGSVTHQGVVEQSAFWANGGPGFEVFPNIVACGGPDTAQIVAFNVTSWGNYQDQNHQTGNVGELALQNLEPTVTGTYSVTNSIFEATTATTDAGSLHMAGGEVWCINLCTSTVSVTGNYIWQSNPGSVFTAGVPNTSVYNNDIYNPTTFPFGTNTYNTPGLANPSSLPTGAPSCTSYTNVTSCMNTGYSVAADLTPSGGAVGLGYKVPGSCAADAYYPTWLKGLVYLQVSPGPVITETAGLVNKPCGL